MRNFAWCKCERRCFKIVVSPTAPLCLCVSCHRSELCWQMEKVLLRLNYVWHWSLFRVWVWAKSKNSTKYKMRKTKSENWQRKTKTRKFCENFSPAWLEGPKGCVTTTASPETGWQINDAAAIRPSKLNYCRTQHRERHTRQKTKAKQSQSLAIVDGYIVWQFPVKRDSDKGS